MICTKHQGYTFGHMSMRGLPIGWSPFEQRFLTDRLRFLTDRLRSFLFEKYAILNAVQSLTLIVCDFPTSECNSIPTNSDTLRNLKLLESSWNSQNNFSQLFLFAQCSYVMFRPVCISVWNEENCLHTFVGISIRLILKIQRSHEKIIDIQGVSHMMFLLSFVLWTGIT